MFELPDMENVIKVTIDKGAVKGDTIRIENDDSGQCKATKL